MRSGKPRGLCSSVLVDMCSGNLPVGAKQGSLVAHFTHTGEFQDSTPVGIEKPDSAGRLPGHVATNGGTPLHFPACRREAQQCETHAGDSDFQAQGIPDMHFMLPFPESGHPDQPAVFPLDQPLKSWE